MSRELMAMKSWSRAVELPPPGTIGYLGDGGDAEIAYRPADELPVIMWDCEQHKRVVVPMRWGMALQSSSLHVSSESIEAAPGFGHAFHEGQRGVVIVHSFSEEKALENGETQRYTIHVRNRFAVGAAVIWRGIETKDRSQLGLDCRIVTVPANMVIASISRRLPAVLAAEDWAKWLGEIPATIYDLKACLKTSDWSVRKESRVTNKPHRSAPAPSPGDPNG